MSIILERKPELGTAIQKEKRTQKRKQPHIQCSQYPELEQPDAKPEHPLGDHLYTKATENSLC